MTAHQSTLPTASGGEQFSATRKMADEAVDGARTGSQGPSSSQSRYPTTRSIGGSWGGDHASNWDADEGSWRSGAGGPPRSFGNSGRGTCSSFGQYGGGRSTGGRGGQRRPMTAFLNAQSQGGVRAPPGPPQNRNNRRWPTAEGPDAPSSQPGPFPRGENSWHTRDGRRPFHEKEMEIFKSTKEKTTGINFDSYDQIDVEVSGRNTQGIEPMNSFRNAADMPPELAANIIRVRYDKPTPVQKHAIPILLADRDLMACAQTGSGKTAAFLFPIIIKMLRQGPPPPSQTNCRDIRSPIKPKPVALVLSPTRELTIQIYEESRKFAFQTGIRTVVVYGGANISEQLHDLSRGCDICVATPGRLNDILERSRISMSRVTYLVLDEADRMLDMGFSPQIHQIVSERDMPTSAEGRQTAMFSATFPREIQQLARDFLRDYVYLTVGRVGSTNEFITQKLIYAEEDEKPKRLLQLLKEARGRVLVFVETKKKADVIEGYLVKQNLQAISIHGDRSQAERSRALELFKEGSCPILVATDVAARGLDIHSITWVINLDLPHSIEDYVHRIGRTGRAGNTGLATSFVNESNRHVVRDLLRLLEEANQEIPPWFLDLTRICSNAANRFGTNRYGDRPGGHRRGRGGADFGGTDMRNFDDHERRTFNAAAGSPRGGVRGGGRGGYGAPSTSSRAPLRSGPQEDDCW